MDLKQRAKYLFKSIFSQFGSVATEDGLVLVYDEEGDIQVGYSILMEVQGEDGISYEKPEDGEYHLNDGRTIVITDGKVAEIREAEAETQPEPEAETQPEQMAETTENENPEAETQPEAEAEPEYDAKAEVEALKQEIADLKAALEELKATVGNMLEAPAEENAFEKQEKKETVEKKSIFQTRK